MSCDTQVKLNYGSLLKEYSKMIKQTAIIILLLIAAGAALSAVNELTYKNLVLKLTDLEALALLPLPGEKCAQWSSYERSSMYDEKSGRILNWNANGDSNGIIRKEGDWRCWRR